MRFGQDERPDIIFFPEVSQLEAPDHGSRELSPLKTAAKPDGKSLSVVEQV